MSVFTTLAIGGTFILTYAGPGFGRHTPEASPIKHYYEELKMDEVCSVIDKLAKFEKAEKQFHIPSKNVFAIFLVKK